MNKSRSLKRQSRRKSRSIRRMSRRRSVRRMSRRRSVRRMSRRRSVRRMSRRRSVRRMSRRRSRSVRRSLRRASAMRKSARLRAYSIAKASLKRAKKFGCKSGEIVKKAYTTKRGVKVSATCIKDLGAQGKGPKVIPPLKEGTLMGYSTKLSQKERRDILKKAMKKYDYATVVRKLNAIRTLLKRTSPDISKQIDSDMKYIQKNYSM